NLKGGSASIPQPLRQMKEQAGERYQPGGQGQHEKDARDYEQEGQFKRLRQPQGAGGIHAQWEDHPPILRVIGKGEMLETMPPQPQNEQKGNPPGGGCPEEEGKAFEKGDQLLQQGVQGCV